MVCLVPWLTVLNTADYFLVLRYLQKIYKLSTLIQTWLLKVVYVCHKKLYAFSKCQTHLKSIRVFTSKDTFWKRQMTKKHLAAKGIMRTNINYNCIVVELSFLCDLFIRYASRRYVNLNLNKQQDFKSI